MPKKKSDDGFEWLMTIVISIFGVMMNSLAILCAIGEYALTPEAGAFVLALFGTFCICTGAELAMIQKNKEKENEK